MSGTKTDPASGTLVLDAQRASDLMEPNPISIRPDATISAARALLIDKGISAAAVLDEGEQLVGVVSCSDILAHDREASVRAGSEVSPQAAPACDEPRVRDIMTPAVFSVAADAPADQIVREMVGLKVHRLFVVKSGGNLVGVVTALDVLRHLR
jgi:CBS domain-containing protein